MKNFILVFFGVFFIVSSNAQTGPWARYDDKMKGEALIRESDGGYLKEVQSILDGGGDVNWQMQPSGLTPLMVAASGGKVQVVELLLKKGANPNLKDAKGQTALDRAKMAGASEVVKLLSFGTATTALPPVPQKQEPLVVLVEKPVPLPEKAVPVKEVMKSVNNPWAPFGTYKVGDDVLFFNGRWNKGKIKEVGSAGNHNGKRAEVGERKYLISREGAYNWNDWIDWGKVTGVGRENYWTDYFIGNWALGEVMAMTTRAEGGYQRDEYSFYAAREALEVRQDKTYRWKLMGGKIISGTWKAADDGAGIVLMNGFQGLSWTLRNETNAAEENIRGIQSARLTTEGKMSIKAKRSL